MLYSVLFYLAMPLIVLRLLWRSLKAPAYRQRLAERFGYIDELYIKKPVLWLHTVSVGETIAAKPLVEALLSNYPQHQLVITTMTPTGSAQVQRLFASAISQGRIVHTYIPYDISGAVHRFLRAIEPQLALFMETEAWPTILRVCQQKNIPTVLVNARLSEKSLAGYQRFSWLTGPVFSRFSIVAAQDASNAQRIEQAGAASVIITGSLKSEIAIDETLLEQAKILKQQWSVQGQRRLLIAASTHQGEEEIILAAYQQLLTDDPQLRLILVPRHPERFTDIKHLCEKQFTVQCRSELSPIVDATQIILADTMGELMLFYGVADIAIVGGSFVERGGHNMLEPAAWGLPIISGPSIFNFADIAHTMCAEKALVVVESQQLITTLQQLLQNTQAANSMGRQAKQYVERNRGASHKTLVAINSYLA